MNKNDFIQEVQDELVFLRNSITPEQAEKLKAEAFNHHFDRSCVYGLLGIGYYEKNGSYNRIGSAHYAMYNNKIVPFEDHDFTPGENRTSLEKYLYMIERCNQLEILKYIKGEIYNIDLHII